MGWESKDLNFASEVLLSWLSDLYMLDNLSELQISRLCNGKKIIPALLSVKYKELKGNSAYENALLITTYGVNVRDGCHQGPAHQNEKLYVA